MSTLTIPKPTTPSSTTSPSSPCLPSSATSLTYIYLHNNRYIMNKYTVVKVIGSGGEAKALLVKKNGTEQLFVLKQRNFTNLEQANEGLNEAMSLAKIQNQNIVKFEEVFLMNNGITHSLCIVMEYCDGGDLMDFMVNLIRHATAVHDQAMMITSPTLSSATNSNSLSPNVGSLGALNVGSHSNLFSFISPANSFNYKIPSIIDEEQSLATPSIVGSVLLEDDRSTTYTYSSTSSNNSNSTNSPVPHITTTSPPSPLSPKSSNNINNINSNTKPAGDSTTTTPTPTTPGTAAVPTGANFSNFITNPSLLKANMLNRSDDVSMLAPTSPKPGSKSDPPPNTNNTNNTNNSHPTTITVNGGSPTQSSPYTETKKKRRSWFKSHRKSKSNSSAMEPHHTIPATALNYPTSPPPESQLSLQIPKKILYNWLYQLCMGVQAIHSAHLIHRDLKSENIFLSNYLIKIGDFGLATNFSEDPIVGIAGTYCYSAPEVLNNEPYSRSSDIFSLGCIIYEMTTLRLLPLTRRYIAEELLAGTFDSNAFLREFPIEHFQIGELCLKMLDLNPQLRPTIEAILQHKMFERFRTIMISASHSNLASLLSTHSPSTSLSPELSLSPLTISSTPSSISLIKSQSLYNVSPLGGFRKQLDRNDLNSAAYILAEAYSNDPRFSWARKRRNNSNGSNSNGNVNGNNNNNNGNVNGNSSVNSSSSTVNGHGCGGTSPLSTSTASFPPPPSSSYHSASLNSSTGIPSSLNSTSSIPPLSPTPPNISSTSKKSGILPLMEEMDEGFFIRKAFFDAALKIMYNERFIIWGYYNSENVLHGVACWISPESKKIPYGMMMLKILSILPKVGLRATKRIKDLMEVLDRAMERTETSENGYHLAYMAISKDYRGKGIGPYLLGPVLEWCDFSNKKAKAIVLKQRSISFFMRQSFDMSYEMKGNDLPEGIDVIWVMERSPKPN
ncbi:hypothetical protein DFA_01796 [Cavenderia fasciculata]|uniref:non-specific serine/threonine protein kinase n=1 Tax=Cavenderia fasciculata TaxID=261658 RepID=F4PUU8_CACFS|nr:uncharacterized protein DFA_01796 [Cavenderia fasciculata]EGG21910.1 hypothetical protein DFA_01796 [Cavenderia fasciculata]|eukprot:XP_004359761.1 hypothetical protein DFA_01796 [Cavenderia fasciculata]